MRLIDADALIEFIDMGHLRSPSEMCFSESDVIDMLESRETIDAEPVRHGHWEERPLRKFPEEHIDVCSVCAGKALAKYNYCPNCGAKMDKVSE